MRRLTMASASGSSARRKPPIVWLFDLDTGLRVPVPSSLDGDGAFGRAVGRTGWPAAHVEYQVGAFVDGDLDDPVLLPEAWQVLPAMSDDLLLLRPYFGRSSSADEPMRAMVVGSDGTVHRQAELPWGVDAGMCGEVSLGVVTRSGIGG